MSFSPISDSGNHSSNHSHPRTPQVLQRNDPIDLSTLEINAISAKPSRRQTGMRIVRDIMNDAQWDLDLGRLQGGEM